MKAKLVKESIDNSNLEDGSLMAKFSQQFEQLFQQAANEGLEFQILEDLIDQALSQIDWEYAAQQVEKYPRG